MDSKHHACLLREARGEVVRQHKEHLENYNADHEKTRLRSGSMPQLHYDEWIGELRKRLDEGKCWLDMYKILREACVQTKARKKQLLPHEFQEPRLAAFSGNSVRLQWSAYGEVVRQHKEHLENHDAHGERTHLKSACMPRLHYDEWIGELRNRLHEGKSWLDMYRMLARACEETKSAGWCLAHAAQNAVSLEQMAECAILKNAMEDLNMHGLQLELTADELMTKYQDDGKGDPLQKNAFPGFRNVGNTCFVNASLQLFMHVAGLRSCIENPEPLPAGDYNNAALLRVREGLRTVLQQHASRRWCAMVPLRVLQAIFALGTQRYAMIAGRQSDAMDCVHILYDSVSGPRKESCWLTPPQQMLRYPVGVHDGLHIGIAQLLQIVQPEEPLHLPSPPETLLLSILPYKLLTDTEAHWVNMVISGWDDLVNMARFFSEGTDRTRYAVKAVMYHVNPGAGLANLRRGHYVTYIKQE